MTANCFYYALRTLTIVLEFAFVNGVASEAHGATEDANITMVFSLMANHGSIKTSSKIVGVQSDENLTLLKTTTGHVMIGFSKETNEVQSVGRTIGNNSDKALTWNEKQVIEKANDYRRRLSKHPVSEKPVMIGQENIDGSRNLWAVSWARKIAGYKVRDDFINITFNEDEGLFGFGQSWSTPKPKFIPQKPLEKPKAVKLAEPAAKRVMQKFPLFTSYRLQKMTGGDLIIVSPNNALSDKVKTEADLMNGDRQNPRLCWVISFKVGLDPNAEGTTFQDATFVAVWIDAETGDCIGAEF